jgi:Mediator complex subunit 28
LLVLQDLAELKAELQRKETLIQRHNEKLTQWQTILSGRGSTPVGGSPSAAGAAIGAPPSAQQPGTPQSAAPMPTQMGVSTPTGTPAFSGPLAYLEQTTSNIGSSRGGT